MPKMIRADGRVYRVPDDATDEEINEIVGPGPKPNYNKLAQQAGAIDPPDYAALAKQAGAIGYQPPSPIGKYTRADLAPDQPAAPQGKYTMADLAPSQPATNQQIDLSAGLIPKQPAAGPIDLSAGVDAAPVGASAPKSMFERAAEFARNNWHSNVDPVPSSAPGSFAHNVGGAAAQAAVAPLQALAHPFDTLSGFGRAIMHPVDTASQAVQSAKSAYQQDPGQFAERAVGTAIGGALGAEVGGPILSRVQPASRISGAIKGTLRGNIDEPILGGNGITPRQQYTSAKQLGVNLDAADATNSPVLRAAKRANENSLFGSHLYDARRLANNQALNTAADQTLTGMSPLSSEQGGHLIQSDLVSNQQSLQDAAAKGFDLLHRQVGNVPVPGMADVASKAGDALANNAAYNGMFPSLAAKQSTSILRDLNEVGRAGAPAVQASPILDEFGRPVMKSVLTPPPTLPNWNQAQQLRSDLLDITRSNPDLVKSKSSAQIEQASRNVDDALAGASSTLTPPERAIFRSSNAKWKEMKDVYDNPQSSLYSAVRTSTPSSLTETAGGKTPEGVRDFKSRVSPQAVGALQRGVADKLMGTTASGELNTRTFPTALARTPDAYKQELFGPKLNELNQISNVSQALARDANPSGTAKLGQKVAEASALPLAFIGHPGGLVPLLQYPVAKAINSPALTDWLMRDAAKRATSAKGAKSAVSLYAASSLAKSGTPVTNQP